MKATAKKQVIEKTIGVTLELTLEEARAIKGMLFPGEHYTHYEREQMRERLTEAFNSVGV